MGQSVKGTQSQSFGRDWSAARVGQTNDGSARQLTVYQRGGRAETSHLPAETRRANRKTTRVVIHRLEEGIALHVRFKLRWKKTLWVELKSLLIKGRHASGGGVEGMT